MKTRIASLFALFLLAAAAGEADAQVQAAAQSPRLPMPIDLEHSAEAGWLKKKVLASRMLDDMTRPDNWTFQGTGKLTFLSRTDPLHMPALRVDMDMFSETPAPTRNRLSSVNLKRVFPGEDWSAYNRI